MPRMKTIEISGVNIVTQPHSPQEYIRILQMVNQKPISVRGNDYLMISGLRPHVGDDWTTGVEGELVKFSNIDEHAKLVDITSGKLVEDEEIPNLPPNIRPNGALFPFIFYPKGHKIGHRLFYISKSRNSSTKKTEMLSPNFVEKLFTVLFSDEQISSQFTSINITVIPASSALPSIFKIPYLNKLYLQINPPNADDLIAFEQNILARLDGMNVDKVEQTYTGSTHESIKPDDELQKLAKVASHNGYVQGTGKNSEGMAITLSTKDVPMKEPIAVESNSVAEREALRSFRP